MEDLPVPVVGFPPPLLNGPFKLEALFRTLFAFAASVSLYVRRRLRGLGVVALSLGHAATNASRGLW